LIWAYFQVSKVHTCDIFGCQLDDLVCCDLVEFEFGFGGIDNYQGNVHYLPLRLPIKIKL